MWLEEGRYYAELDPHAGHPSKTARRLPSPSHPRREARPACMPGVKRLVRTSRGWVELDISDMPVAGFNVRVTVFGDRDWALSEETWNAKWPVNEGSLAAYLSEMAYIPMDEASRIAEESVREWRERGGEDEERLGRWEMIAYMGGTFGLAAIGVLALLALVVFLVLRLI
jgi:hypothetical protein